MACLLTMYEQDRANKGKKWHFVLYKRNAKLHIQLIKAR